MEHKKIRTTTAGKVGCYRSLRILCFLFALSRCLVVVLVDALQVHQVKRNITPTNHYSAHKSKKINLGLRVALKARRLFAVGERQQESANGSPLSKENSVAKKMNVNFCAPLLDYGYPPTVAEYRDNSISEKPILLYLPGFDGTYICPFIQFPELGTEFEVWCMTVAMDDRSTFEELKQNVLDFIQEIQISPKGQLSMTNRTSSAGQEQENLTKKEGNFFTNLFKQTQENNSKGKKRPIYLAGESFGGVLASEVALTILKDNQQGLSVDLKGLVLINPATCYDRSSLAIKGPSVATLPSLLYPFGLFQMLPLFADEFSFQQLLLILLAKALPSVVDSPERESYMGRVAFSLPNKLEYMSQETLAWRLKQWLEVGCARMDSERMSEFSNKRNLRTLIIAGERDLTLPSIAEAERLANILPNSQVHVVEGAGHASTCGSRLDLTAVMRGRFSELRKPNKANKDAARQKMGGKVKTKQSKATLYQKNGGDSNEDFFPSPMATATLSELMKVTKRTAMKETASEGTGAYFGMEPRYDGADIGLNPILYWSKENFQSVRRSDEERFVDSRMYRKANYSQRK